MASNITLNAGTGGSTLATEQNGSSEHYQKIKITDGTATAFTNNAAVTSGSALKVDNSGVVQPINDNGGSITVDNAGTFATQAAQSGTWNVTNVSGTVSLPTGAATVAKQPALGVAGTASTDVITVQGIAAMTALKVDGSGVTQPVSGTFWQATQPVSGTFWQATQPVSGTVTTSPPSNASSNVAQVNGVTPLMGNGITGTGSQRVTIASDNTAFAVNATLQTSSAVVGHVIADSGSTTAVTGTVAVTESGTWTVQPGNTANTTPWLVTESPATSGGLTMFSAVLAASNNLTSVKASAGQVYGIQAFGTGSAPYWLKLYNKASAPVVASDSALIVKRILVPANATAANGAGVTVPINDMGLAFSTGIAFSCVGLQADGDTTNTAAAGAVNIDYK